MRRRITTRFLYDLQPFLDLGRPLEDVNKAKFLVRYFVDEVAAGAQPVPDVTRYIAQAIDRAGSSKDLDRELGLKRIRAGNPGPSSSSSSAGGQPKKRRLSHGDREEIPVRFVELLGTQIPRLDAIRLLAIEYEVSQRTISNIVAEHEADADSDALPSEDEALIVGAPSADLIARMEAEARGDLDPGEVPQEPSARCCEPDTAELLSVLKASRGKNCTQLRAIIAARRTE